MTYMYVCFFLSWHEKFFKNYITPYPLIRLRFSLRNFSSHVSVSYFVSSAIAAVSGTDVVLYHVSLSPILSNTTWYWCGQIYSHTRCVILTVPPLLVWTPCCTATVMHLALIFCKSFTELLTSSKHAYGFWIDIYSCRKQFLLEYCAHMQFLLPLILKKSTHLQSYLGQLLPPTPSVR